MSCSCTCCPVVMLCCHVSFWIFYMFSTQMLWYCHAVMLCSRFVCRCCMWDAHIYVLLLCTYIDSNFIINVYDSWSVHWTNIHKGTDSSYHKHEHMSYVAFHHQLISCSAFLYMTKICVCLVCVRCVCVRVSLSMRCVLFYCCCCFCVGQYPVINPRRSFFFDAS